MLTVLVFTKEEHGATKLGAGLSVFFFFSLAASLTIRLLQAMRNTNKNTNKNDQTNPSDAKSSDTDTSDVIISSDKSPSGSDDEVVDMAVLNKEYANS